MFNVLALQKLYKMNLKVILLLKTKPQINCIMKIRKDVAMYAAYWQVLENVWTILWLLKVSDGYNPYRM